MIPPRSLNERAVDQSKSCLQGITSLKCMSEFVHERASLLSDRPRTSRLSTSLCRVIFKSPEVNDATLFVGILQTDLMVLKALGHPGDSATTSRLLQVANLIVIHQPVDRILRQKKEREAAEAEVLSTSSAPETTAQETQTEIPTMQPKIPSLVTEATAPSELPAPSCQGTPGNTGPGQTSKRPYGPVHHQHPNRPDSPSSQPTPSLKSEDIPGLPRDSTTPLSNIGTSLSTDLSGFHLILHFI